METSYLYQLIFRHDDNSEVIHIGTWKQCEKTVAVYTGAYQLLHDHGLLPAYKFEAIKSSFNIVGYEVKKG